MMMLKAFQTDIGDIGTMEMVLKKKLHKDYKKFNQTIKKNYYVDFTRYYKF